MKLAEHLFVTILQENLSRARDQDEVNNVIERTASLIEGALKLEYKFNKMAKERRAKWQTETNG